MRTFFWYEKDLFCRAFGLSAEEVLYLEIFFCLIRRRL